MAKKITTIRELIYDLEYRIRNASEHPNGVSGIASGLHDLDVITAGWNNSELVLIAGRRCMGKTSFLISMLNHILLQQNKRVLFLSPELSKFQISTLLVSNVFETETAKLRNGNVFDNNFEMLNYMIGKIGESALYINDSSFLTAEDIREILTKDLPEYKSGFKFDIVMIDNLNGLCKTGIHEAGQILRELKSIAKEFEIPVLVSYEMDKYEFEEDMESRPELPELSFFDDQLNLIDIICFIYRAEYYHLLEDGNGESTIGKVEIIVKQQYGISDTAILGINPYYRKLYNLDSKIKTNEQT